MMIRSRNFLVLIIIFLLSGLFVLVAQHYFDVDPNNLIACPEETVEPCEDDVLLPAPEPSEPDLVACTADAMECPDGSYVGRVGPDCEFAACPADMGDVQGVDSFEDCAAAGNPIMESYPRQCVHEGERFVEEIADPIESEVTYCTEEMKQAEFCTLEYAPVCGLVDVQCVTTPCDPVPETFGNGCQACAQGNVLSYEVGSCEDQS